MTTEFQCPCRTCGLPIEWGWDNITQRWIPLEPVTTHDDLPRSFVDEDNVLRADHRERHHKGSVNVTRLSHKIPADVANAPEDEEVVTHIDEKPKRQRRAKKVG